MGGGFGGLAAAKALAEAMVEVHLVDRRNHHLFQPLLYQVATAGLNPADIAAPIRSVLRTQRNATVHLGEVRAVTGNEVVLADGSTIAFDRLIVAAGARHSYFGHDEWEAHAPGLKSIEDALEIRRRVLLAFERAERTDDAGERDRLLTFVIVGAGPTGVELAGAIAEIATKTMVRDFRSIDPSRARIILVEGTDRVLGTYPAELSESARRQLTDLGVDVRLGTMVEQIDDAGVTTNDGRIDARTVIWGAGVQASRLGAELRDSCGAELDQAGRVKVDETLAIPSRPDIFVVGDLAHATSGGRSVPGVAQGAIQGGAHAAQAILADLAGEARPDFRYRDKGELATIGRSSAVGVIAGRRLSGWIAWMAWWTVHIMFLINFRSRVVVLFSWAWSYLTFQRGARLVTGPWSPATDPKTRSDTG